TNAGEICSERIEVNGFPKQCRIVKDAGPGADYGLSVAPDIPGQAHAGREIPVSGFPHGGKSSAPNLGNGRSRQGIGVRIEIRDVIMALVRTPVVLVTEAEIQGQSWSYAPIVLNEARIGASSRHRRRIPHEEGAILCV